MISSKNKFFLLLNLLVCLSCHKSPNDRPIGIGDSKVNFYKYEKSLVQEYDKIKVGLSVDELIKLMGEPSSKLSKHELLEQRKKHRREDRPKEAIAMITGEVWIYSKVWPVIENGKVTDIYVLKKDQ